MDNTLNLTSSNTTSADVEAFEALCKKENIDEEWCAAYFSEVQESVEADLKNALFGDIKTVRDNVVLPTRMAQISVWNTESILSKLPEIRRWFADIEDSWMINVIDIKHRCCYFVCDDEWGQKKIEKVFGVCFDGGVAKSSTPYLRKEIIKKTKIYT